jgi:hypothetical protein
MSKRLSLTLEPDDETTVRAFTERDTPERHALDSWARAHGLSAHRLRSDAALMRVLIRAGAEALREQVLADGYAELAAMYGPQEQAEHDALTDDYAAHVDAEMAP